MCKKSFDFQKIDNNIPSPHTPDTSNQHKNYLRVSKSMDDSISSSSIQTEYLENVDVLLKEGSLSVPPNMGNPS